jgi:hypothetical protein
LKHAYASQPTKLDYKHASATQPIKVDIIHYRESILW